MTARVSMSLKSRASLTYFRACVLPGRAKDLSAPPYLNTVKYEMTERMVPVSGFAWRHAGDLTWVCLHTRHAGFGSRTKKRTSSRTVVYPERALWSDRLARCAPVGLRQPEAGRRRIWYVALPGSATALHRPPCSVCYLTTALYSLNCTKRKAFL